MPDLKVNRNCLDGRPKIGVPVSTFKLFIIDLGAWCSRLMEVKSFSQEQRFKLLGMGYVRVWGIIWSTWFCSCGLHWHCIPYLNHLFTCDNLDLKIVLTWCVSQCFGCFWAYICACNLSKISMPLSNPLLMQKSFLKKLKGGL